jgi:GT2 family glycosyltransferase
MSGETRPALSVVIASWNTAALLEDCLASLFLSPPPDQMEAIVVDNASSDDSAARVRRNWPAVRLIQNAQNLGFARANNQGITASRGRYILLLNSDTVAPPGALAGLVDFMDEHPEAGAVGPRLLRPDGRPQPFAFGGDPTPLYLLRRGLNLLLLRRPLHDWNTDRTQAVDWVSGACLLLRREALEQSGPLDEAIFMYYEDNDLCLRLRRRGWKVYYHPGVSITHFGGQSLAQNPAARKAYYASLEYFYRKHYGSVSQLWLRLSLPFYQLVVR